MTRILTFAALVCASLPALAGITHWAVPAMSDVQRLPDAEPKDGEKGGIVRIVAAKDEYEPGSFVAVSDADIGKQSLTIGEFKSAEGKVFPAQNLDLKFVKVWYQNKNGWFSYFGDTGFKLCPELLVNDEDLVRVDTKKQANYARLVEKDGRVHEHWINSPRQLDRRYDAWPFYNDSTFEPLKENFMDAATLQPVAFQKGQHKQFFLTVHVTKDIPASLYKGEIRIRGQRSKVKGQTEDDKSQSLTSDLGSQAYSIPVEIKVLDFELPRPKGYYKPNVEYRVSSYNYYIWDIMLAYNGGNIKLAQKQFRAIMKNLAAHNQFIHQWNGPHPWNLGFKMSYDALKEAGMCVKPLPIGGPAPSGRNKAERMTNAVALVKRLDRTFGHHDVLISFGDEPSSDWQRGMRAAFEDFQRFGLKFRIAGNEQTYNPNGYLWDWFNCAATPLDPTQVDLWSKTLDINVSWYAQQHVGAENPALNRRMYGMAPWLTGYTAIDNYAHHLGSWNDDRTTYKPMCFTYGVGNGVLDTLSWEGFREGVDDIRYGTLMCRLAREAQARGDVEAKKAGGKALQYLAMFDKAGADLNASRAEMIGYIQRLKAVLATKPEPLPDFTFPTFEEKVAKAKAELEKVRATKHQYNTEQAIRKLAGLYVGEQKFDEAIRIYEDAKLYGDALGVYNSGYFRQTNVNLAPELAEEFLYSRVTKPNCPEAYRRAAYIGLREHHPEEAEKCADAFWGKNDRKTRLKILEGLAWGWVNWNNDHWVQGQRKTTLFVWRMVAKIALEEKVVINNDDRCVQWALQNFSDAGDIEGLKYVADALLQTNRYSAAVNYRIRMARELLPQNFATPAAAEAAVRAFDAKNAGKLKPQQRVDQLCLVGSCAGCLNKENTVRGFDAYRKALYKPQPRKEYVIRYSEKPIAGESDWAALKLPSEKFDRPFGGSMEFLATDVTTGNRGAVATGDRKKKAAPPEMQVAADENGVHFRFVIPEPKAREVQLKLAGAGSFESYLGPGENTPYVCFLLTPSSRKVGAFNTTYDTEGERMLKEGDTDKAQFNTIFYDDRIVCTLDLDWSLYPSHLPKDGDVWDFESARWGSAGGQCWNGMESIHGRSTWGALKFALTEKQRLAIVRRQVFAAWALYKYENTAWRHEGCLKHWKDTETGDPQFHADVIKPLMDRLEPYGKLMKADMSDEDLKKVYAEAYPTWVDIVHVVGRLRAKYLAEKEFK